MLTNDHMMIVMIVWVMETHLLGSLARIPAGWVFIDTCEEFTNGLAVWVAAARSNDKLRHPLVLIRLLPHLL